MVYQLKSGSRIKSSAAVVGAECERLEREGRLTAKELVNESRPKDAPLHNEFEWRDKVAGELWREQQARHIINSVIVINERKEPQRVFFNIEVTKQEYHSVETILQSEGKRAALLKTALRELEAFQTKYAQLTELCGVFDAITALKEGA